MKKQNKDPWDLEHVDQETRIKLLRAKLKEISGGQFFEEDTGTCPPDLKEQFLRQVLAFETAELTTLWSLLSLEGYSFPPPDELDEASIHDHLWELLHALETVHVYLEHTNHLSDRQLYEFLWKEALRDEIEDMSHLQNTALHLDPLGGCSDEDNSVYLKYYADESVREEWGKDVPFLPAHEDPPHDRDQYLPRPSITRSETDQ